MYDLLLKGAHVVDPLNDVNGVNDVAVEGGKIAAVGPDLTGPPAKSLMFPDGCSSPASSTVTCISAVCGGRLTDRVCSR